MTMYQFSITGLQSKDAGNTYGHLGHFLASRNLGFCTLDFGNAREAFRNILCNKSDAGISTVSVFGCGDGQSLFHVFATSSKWTERIAKCHVISVAKKREVSTRIAPDDRS